MKYHKIFFVVLLFKLIILIGLFIWIGGNCRCDKDFDFSMLDILLPSPLSVNEINILKGNKDYCYQFDYRSLKNDLSFLGIEIDYENDSTSVLG